MKLKPVIYSFEGGRMMHLAQSMRDGLKRHGINVGIETKFRGGPDGNVAIAYGWIHKDVFRAYEHFVFIDLGFWNRKPQGAAREGHHRVAIDNWCVTPRMLRDMPGDRFDALRVGVEDGAGRPDGPVLIAGQSRKAAGTHGLQEGEWEDDAKRALDALGVKSVLRAKPTGKSAPVAPINDVLRTTSGVATHHSNVAVDALALGVPYFCDIGAGRELSQPSLETLVKAPIIPSHAARTRLLNDLAYAQWAPAEMRDGSVWDYVSEVLK